MLKENSGRKGLKNEVAPKLAQGEIILGKPAKITDERSSYGSSVFDRF